MQKPLCRAEQPSSVRRNPSRHARKLENLPRADLRNRYQRRIQRVIQAERMHSAAAQRHIEHHSRHGQAAQQRQRPRAHQQHFTALARRNRQHVARLVKRYVLRIQSRPRQHERQAASRVKQKNAVRFRAKQQKARSIRRRQDSLHPRPARKKPGRHKPLGVQPPNRIAPIACAEHSPVRYAERPRAFQPDLLLRLAFRRRKHAHLVAARDNHPLLHRRHTPSPQAYEAKQPRVTSRKNGICVE